MEWQSIETAPKDGSLIAVIFAGVRENQNLPYCPSLAFWDGEQWMDPDDLENNAGWELSHWMPLPSPPTSL